LTAANSELSANAESLNVSLSDAKDEIDRLDFVALLRKRTVDNLRGEVAGLKQAGAASDTFIARLHSEADAAGARIKQLEETIKNLSNPDN
jgi:predicted  nucleic acid-binding Zn-ribbon protein